jgi:hypothetical protein
VETVGGETQDDEHARREREGLLARRVLTAASIVLTPVLGDVIDVPTGRDDLSLRSQISLWFDGVKAKFRRR